MKEINILELDNNVFDLISKKWGLVTVKCNDKVNAMTVSWVQLGHLWNKNVVTVYIRPQRYTYEFIEKEDTFSLAFFVEGHREQLAYLGSISGRDEDKLKKCNYTTTLIDGVPVIDQADLVLLCKKIYVDDIKSECFLDNDLKDACYPKSDFHRAYTAVITKVLVQ